VHLGWFLPPFIKGGGSAIFSYKDGSSSAYSGDHPRSGGCGRND
jgi:hypothetical protein